jgi:hypothetical protein
VGIIKTWPIVRKKKMRETKTEINNEREKSKYKGDRK